MTLALVCLLGASAAAQQPAAPGRGRGSRPVDPRALAPSAFAVDREGLGRIPKMPIMLVHGDMDTVVPVTVGRAWAEAMKSVPMKTYEYIEVPGGDHGTVIGSRQAEIFAFFAKQSR
jgi:pimeloyl-ACP methyl ester carboxylesterase